MASATSRILLCCFTVQAEGFPSLRRVHAIEKIDIAAKAPDSTSYQDGNRLATLKRKVVLHLRTGGRDRVKSTSSAIVPYAVRVLISKGRVQAACDPCAHARTLHTKHVRHARRTYNNTN